jgi:NadR type nicotinamide-nucleotide adenylyltransferase
LIDQQKIIKVAITGPESTGKSWLSEKLALHYHTVYVPEIARSYLDSLDRDYNQEDITQIARAQVNEEERMLRHANGILFCDTELLVTKIWSMHKFQGCDPWILHQISLKPYDLYLLCDIDLPWEFDPQREHPHLREYFLNYYKSELDAYNFPYYIIKGKNDQRVNNAIAAINDFFNI